LSEKNALTLIRIAIEKLKNNCASNIAHNMPKFINEPVFIDHNGEAIPYIPKEIVTHRDAYAASLHMILKHTADFHVMILEIVADKQGINIDDLVKVIKEDSRYTDMSVNPQINTLGFFQEAPAPKADVEMEAVTEGMKAVTIKKSRVLKKK
jgi:hypothetical protein